MGGAWLSHPESPHRCSAPRGEFGRNQGLRHPRHAAAHGGLTPATFESDRQNDQFVATLLFHHFLGPDDWRWLHSLGVSNLIDEEARALVYVRETFTIDNATYRDLNRVDALNASHHLRRLRDQGFLDQRGKGSATYYLPGERFLASLETDPALAAPASLSGNPPVLSGNPPPLSGNPPDVQPGNREALLQTLPENLRQELESLKKRVSQPDLSAFVRELCRARAFSADEIAALLGKNRKYVLGRILTPLQQQGLLSLTIPNQPNHPDQAYTTPRDL